MAAQAATGQSTAAGWPYHPRAGSFRLRGMLIAAGAGIGLQITPDHRIHPRWAAADYKSAATRSRITNPDEQGASRGGVGLPAV